MTTTASLAFEYGEADIPDAVVPGRVKAPNPHTDIVKYLYENIGKLDKPARLIPVPNVSNEDGKYNVHNEDGSLNQTATNEAVTTAIAAEVARHKRMLREIATEGILSDTLTVPPFSIRTGPDRTGHKTVGTGKAAKQIPVTIITFWVHTVEDDKGNIVPARITRKPKSRAPIVG